MLFNTLIINFPIYTIIYITRKYVMNQTSTHNNNNTHIARCPGRLSLVEKYTGHVRSRVRTCPAPWGMSAQEHTFTFCQFFYISGGNYTLIPCIQYTTMFTHSECEISQSWRTQLSSHGALNLNRAVMPPFPLLHKMTITTYDYNHCIFFII